MTNHEAALNQLYRLALPDGSFMVMGSGILEALNIRMADDIDLVVRTDTYEHLIGQGWTTRVASNGAIGLESGIFQAYDAWNDEGTVKNIDELLVDAEWVHGVPFNSLAKLALYKKRRGRDKDLADLQLIERYIARIDE